MLSAMGVDIEASFSATAATIGNVRSVGGSFSALEDHFNQADDKSNCQEDETNHKTMFLMIQQFE